MKDKLCIVTTVRASKQELMEFVSYHLNIGIDHIFLFFDDPNDKNLDLFNNNQKISNISCTPHHWESLGCSQTSDIEVRQKANANLAVRLAKEKEIEWITHIDIDELIYSKNNLTEIINKTPKHFNYIWLRPYEAIPNSETCLSAFQEIYQFKILSEKNLQQLKSQTSDSKSLENILYLEQFFRGHMGGKSIVKISDNLKCIGIHKPIFIDESYIDVVENEELHLLHYDCYNYENWFTKWERRYDGTATFNGRKNRKEQYNEFTNAYESNSKEKLLSLYQRYYLLTDSDKSLLKQFELIKEIEIPKHLFSNTNK